MALENAQFPEQSSHLSSLSAEDSSVYRKILYGTFGFYTAAFVLVAGAAIAGTTVQKVAHIVMASLS